MATDAVPAAKAMSVLFVCHANRCRSPMAERLAELALARRLGVDTRWDERPDTDGVLFASAGTHAYAGDPMHQGSLRVLVEQGASARPFASRPVDETMLNGSQLILTADRDQRAHCVRLTPAAVRRAFTLREFGRLCGAVDPTALPASSTAATRMRALVGAAFAARARFPPVSTREDDLDDPVNRPPEDFRTCARTITAILELVAGLVIVNPVGTGRLR